MSQPTIDSQSVEEEKKLVNFLANMVQESEKVITGDSAEKSVIFELENDENKSPASKVFTIESK